MIMLQWPLAYRCTIHIGRVLAFIDFLVRMSVEDAGNTGIVSKEPLCVGSPTTIEIEKTVPATRLHLCRRVLDVVAGRFDHVARCLGKSQGYAGAERFGAGRIGDAGICRGRKIIGTAGAVALQDVRREHKSTNHSASMGAARAELGAIGMKR